MKKTLHLAIYVMAIVAFVSCGGTGNDKKGKFNPKERTSTLSYEEKAAALEAKRRELLPVNVDSLLLSHSVNFSVLPPAITDNVPAAASEKLGSKMIQVASQNGVGGLCTNPVLAMVARVDCVDRSVTGTAPQKVIVKYEVTYYCGNLITNDIYASCTQELTGVGANITDAACKAFNEMKNDSKMQKMLSTASERAIKWYSSTANVKRLVDKAISDRKYDLAIALLGSVPQEAAATYAYAEKRNAEVSEMLFEEKASELLSDLEGAIAAAGDEFDPELGAYLRVIPPRSTSYARAKSVYDDYVKRVRDVNDDKRNKEHELEMEKLAVEKIKAPYEAAASLEEMKQSASLRKHEMWSGALSSSMESLGKGLRGGLFGENGMFGKGGLFGVGSFAEPINTAVGGIFGGNDD